MDHPPAAAMHDWHIEPREYRRHAQRRGRRHAFVHLDPRRTALTVIDMVPFFVARNPYCRGIVPNIARLAGMLRGAGGLVAWIVPGSRQPHPDLARAFFGPAVAELYRTSGGDGAPRTRLWPELAPHDDDPVLEKSAPSAFFPGACPLGDLLRGRGIDTVLIAGTVTNICCESSARDACASGYRVIMVADANAARRDRDHNAALHNVYRSFGDVRTTDEVVALIADAAGPSRAAR